MQFNIYRTRGDGFARIVFHDGPDIFIPLKGVVRADGQYVLRGTDQMPGWSLSLEYVDDDASND